MNAISNSITRSDSEPIDVSLIVPCYNVEAYIGRCLDSLVDQKGATFEIVCVDDGSTDGTRSVLDSYAHRYSNIRIVAKDNSGLADARNAGVNAASGQFVSFIDSDDFVSGDYLETLWRGHLAYSADLIVSDLVPVSDKYVAKLRQQWASSTATYRLVPRAEVGTLLLSEALPCAACGKLILKEICLDHPFHSGRFHEDVEIIASYYLSAHACVKASKPLYGYYMRKGSITHALAPDKKQMRDFIQAYRTMEKSVIQSVGCSPAAIAHHRIITACRFHSMARRACGKRFDADEAQVIVEADEALANVSAPNLSRAVYYRYLLLKKAPLLYDAFFSIYERYGKGRVSSSLRRKPADGGEI